MELSNRDAVSRARHFLRRAGQYSAGHRDDYEADLDAAIVFARAALHRLDSKFRGRRGWKAWWDSLLDNESVRFFIDQRNQVLKEGPLKVGQVIRVGKRTERAEEHYYFESPDITATTTVEKHLDNVARLVVEAEKRFAQDCEYFA